MVCRLKRSCLLALASLIAGSLAAGSALAQQPIVLKFSHVVAPNTPKGKGAERFRELAERYTKGRVKVEVHPNSQLYKDKEELEALQLGAVQMLAPSLAKFAPLGVREFEVFDLPFIFPDRAALSRVVNGPIGQQLFSKLEAKGIIGLAYWDNGFKVMSANRPLKRPEDFSGLRMRIQHSRVLEVQMRALGAIPLAMAFSESHAALQAGVADGTENVPSNMYTQQMHEVQRHTTLSDHGYLGYAVIVNRKFWDALPGDLRQALRRAMTEATQYANSIAQEENEQALKAMEASGRTEFHRLSSEDRAAWLQALRPVHEDFASRINRALVEAIHRETGMAP